jgi:hypothetical protein
MTKPWEVTETTPAAPARETVHHLECGLLEGDEDELQHTDGDIGRQLDNVRSKLT